MFNKSMLEPCEVLLLSYGLGLYRITSLDNLDVELEPLKSLGIKEIIKSGDVTYLALSLEGVEPSKYELSIQDTDEFISDERFIMSTNLKSFKDRFYQLHKRNS